MNLIVYNGRLTLAAALSFCLGFYSVVIILLTPVQQV